MWKAEALWEARVSPWRALADVSDDELAAVLAAAHRAMQDERHRHAPGHARSIGAPAARAIRCGSVIRSAPQGEHARIAYWCPGCQAGGEPPPAS